MAGCSSASWATWCARNGRITKDTPPPFDLPSTTSGYTPGEIDGGPAGAALARADRLVKRLEVKSRAEVPDDPSLVIGLDQVLQGHGREDLLTVRLTQTRGGSVAHGPPRCTAA